ncbi:MAG: MaoC/PaaZ C-terminal domain-containing protein [Candidatus Diapherotrites archaeon]
MAGESTSHILSLEQLKPRQKFSLKKKVSESGVRRYAELSRDFNRLHLDEAYCSKTIFRSRILHGMHLLGIAASAYPLNGVNSVALSYEANFLKPARIDDELLITREIVSVDLEKRRFSDKTEIRNSRGELLVSISSTEKLLSDLMVK